MIKALIFDFDGVLVSSEGPRYRALQKLLASYNLQISDDLKSWMPGRTTQSVLEQLIPDNPKLVSEIILEYRTKYVQDITKFVEPIEFTVDYLRNYNGNLKIAIASMSSREAIESLTKHFGIFEKINTIVTKEDVINHKPDPEIYLKAAEKLDVNPKDCMVLEDTVIGVQAALAAGMDCCVILNGMNKKEDMDELDVKAFIATENQLIETIGVLK